MVTHLKLIIKIHLSTCMQHSLIYPTPEIVPGRWGWWAGYLIIIIIYTGWPHIDAIMRVKGSEPEWPNPQMLT